MTGYSLVDGNPIGAEKAEGIQLRATRIDKFIGMTIWSGPLREWFGQL